MWTLFLNTLFPPYCLGCKQRGKLLCGSCLDSLPSAPAERGALALFNYEHPLVRKIIWKFKYSGLKSLAVELSPLLKQLILEEVSERRSFSPHKILVMPVPLSPGRSRERGYNQAALLSEALVRLLPDDLIYMPDVLLKIKDTPTQVSMKTRAARLENLIGAFKVVEPEKIKNRSVLLIDDVLTTGATIMTAREELIKNGASEVLAVVLAHGE